MDLNILRLTYVLVLKRSLHKKINREKSRFNQNSDLLVIQAEI